MDDARAREIIGHMGRVFRVERFAQETIDDLPFYIKHGEDPVVVGWDVFTGLLRDRGELERAIANGVNRDKVVHRLTAYVRFQDAEDLAQIVLLNVYTSFHTFRPERKSSWRRWLGGITKNHLNMFLSKLYTEAERMKWKNTYWFECYQVEEEEEIDEVTEKRYEQVRVVAERWISGTHGKKALYAARVLATLNGEDAHVGLSGSFMGNYTGVSRQTLSKWTRQFITEVHSEGKG